MSSELHLTEDLNTQQILQVIVENQRIIVQKLSYLCSMIDEIISRQDKMHDMHLNAYNPFREPPIKPPPWLDY